MRSSIFSSKLVAFAAALTLCLLPGMVLNRLFPESDDLKLVNTRSFFCSKVRTDRYQVIAYGDSRTYKGVKTPALKDMLGLSCYNCGFSGGGINEEMVKYIDSKLDRTSDGPLAVILGLTPQMLSEKARDNAHYHEQLEIYRNLGEQVFGERGGRRGLFSPYPLRRRLDTLANAESHDDGDEVWQDGWMGVKSPASEQIRQKRHEHTRRSYEARFAATHPSERSLEELARGVARWTQDGVAVFCFRVPTCGWMIALEDERSGCDMKRVRKVVERNGAVWIDLDQTKYETYDGTHLSGVGAGLMTADLASAVREALRKRKSAATNEISKEE